MSATNGRQHRSVSRNASIATSNTIPNGVADVERGLAPKLGGTAALVLFGLILTAFVVQSGITQHIQMTLNFREPYLLFFIAHCTFSLIFPMHMCYLLWTTSHSTTHYMNLLVATLQLHYRDPLNPTLFPYRRLAIVAILLTIGMALPGLLWYLAVSLASISSVTAIWNTNAFWAYLLAVRFLENELDSVAVNDVDEHTLLSPVVPRGSSKWWKRLEPAKLVATGVACLGVIVVVYSGKGEETDDIPPPNDRQAPSAPLVGILLTLAASVLYALMQVLYKKYVSLPDGPSELIGVETSPLTTYRRLSTEAREAQRDETSLEDDDDIVENGHTNGEVEEIPSDVSPGSLLPFGLYANFISSLVGIGTFLLLWPLLLIPVSSNPLPTPSTPSGVPLIPSIIILAFSGLTFNTAYLILLSIWGPVLISVGNLLTIILMLLVEVTIMDGPLPTLMAMIGCGMIAGGFGVLLWSMKVHER